MPLIYCRARIVVDRWANWHVCTLEKKYCANDVIPKYERYYEQVLEGVSDHGELSGSYL